MKQLLKYVGLIIVIVFILFTSCKNSPITKTNKNIALKGVKISFSGLACPQNMKIIDSLIIIQDACDSFYYHVYNTYSLKSVGKFAKRGKGPCEYLSPILLTQVIRKNNGLFVNLFDNKLGKFDGINILEAIKKNYYPNSYKIKPADKKNIFPLGSIVFTSENCIIGTSQNGQNKGRFFCYDIVSGKLSWEPYYPKLKRNPDPKLVNDLYTCKMALRPDGEDIAVSSLYFKRIDILSKRGQLERSVVFETQIEEPDFSTTKKIPPVNSYFYMSDISVSQKYIYVLDLEANAWEYIKYFEKGKSFGDTISLIKVDWEGNYINTFKLTPRVSIIAVDEANSKIYGIGEASETASFFVYEMI